MAARAILHVKLRRSNLLSANWSKLPTACSLMRGLSFQSLCSRHLSSAEHAADRPPEEEAACSSPLGDGEVSLKMPISKEMISLIRQFPAPYLLGAFALGMLPERVESG